MSRCLISFGANLGDAKSTVQFAARMLQQSLPAGDRIQLSRLYETPPVGGPPGQSAFVNAVAALTTSLSVWDVWHIIRQVEQSLGRQRQRRWEARQIDLDILLFDDAKIWTPHLKVPHPRMCMRRFIIVPCLDVAADWLDPVTGKKLFELAAWLESTTQRSLLVASDSSSVGLICGNPSNSTEGSSTSIDNLQVWQRDLSWCFENEKAKRLSELLSPCSLLFVWVHAVEGSAWEDQHRDLAIRLGLSPTLVAKPQIQPWTISIPRYLLATNDCNWARHELAAAISAMTCEVDVID